MNIRKLTPFLIACCFYSLASCTEEQGTTTGQPAHDTTITTNSTLSSHAAANNRFAVVITYKPEDKARIADKIGPQSEQLDNWWNLGLVENVYYQSSAPVRGTDSLPVVSFFIRAADEYGARVILDSSIMVRNDYATYTLHPVGNLGLPRQSTASDVFDKKGHVYVVIYDFKGNWKDIPEATIRQQAARDQELNKQGVLENAYIDSKGDATATFPAVYFINAASAAEARHLVAGLPVVKGGYATFRVKEAGSFMKGIKQ